MEQHKQELENTVSPQQHKNHQIAKGFSNKHFVNRGIWRHFLILFSVVNGNKQTFSDM
jgi:hypothetical protein